MTFRVITGGRRDGPEGALVVRNAAEVATLAGGIRRGAAMDDPATLSPSDDPGGLALAAWEGRIVAVGPWDEVQTTLGEQGIPLSRLAQVDARGGTVTPGLVDPHTHLPFAGSRERELVLRQRGAGYLEILEAGGGILSTVAATRAASAEGLRDGARRWLDEMVAHGVTTIEAKSGYGLDTETELRQLEVLGALHDEGPIEIVPTFLGAHAVPREFRGRPDATEAYVSAVVDDQLPAVAAQGIARFCDVFCEEGVFTADQARRILVAARRLGLDVRLHADELAPSGAAELAAELGAASADHLAVPSAAGLDALAKAASSGRPVVATLLPATTWFLMSEHHAPAREFIERGVPVALGTDFNPGTSPTASLPLVMTVACLALRLTPAEALAAVTINAAAALRLDGEIGSLEVGKAADLVVWDVPTAAQIPYWPGAALARVVVKRGRVVYERPR